MCKYLSLSLFCSFHLYQRMYSTLHSKSNEKDRKKLCSKIRFNFDFLDSWSFLFDSILFYTKKRKWSTHGLTSTLAYLFFLRWGKVNTHGISKKCPMVTAKPKYAFRPLLEICQTTYSSNRLSYRKNVKTKVVDNFEEKGLFNFPERKVAYLRSLLIF